MASRGRTLGDHEQRNEGGEPCDCSKREVGLLRRGKGRQQEAEVPTNRGAKECSAMSEPASPAMPNNEPTIAAMRVLGSLAPQPPEWNQIEQSRDDNRWNENKSRAVRPADTRKERVRPGFAGMLVDAGAGDHRDDRKPQQRCTPGA